MPLISLYGHEALRDRLARAQDAGSLPASLLLEGSRGVGKQRLALWLGARLLCEQPGTAADGGPCGECQQCRYTAALTHPDLHWYFPRPRLKDSDPNAADVAEDYGEAIAERMERGGLYPAPPATDAIYVVTVRAMVASAAVAPALASRKVYIVGDAERMVAQEGSDQAANAFLKLLEEPPANTHVILTSSEPGALLPTIRSRVVSVRVPGLTSAAARAFVEDPAVRAALPKELTRAKADDLLALAHGAPGRLFSHEGWAGALENARNLLDAVTASPEQRLAIALGQGASKARGSLMETLEALVVLLHARARDAVQAGESEAARGAAMGITAVQNAREMAMGNVNPQLITANLLRELALVTR